MRPCGRPSAPAGCALGRRMTRLLGGRGSDRDGYRPGIRLAGLVALILALMAPLPASAAQDALPNLDAVVLAPADLSGGFIVSTDRAASFVDAAHALAPSAVTSPAAQDRNAIVLERQDEGGMEFVVALLIAPISDADREAFDASTTVSRQQLDELAALFEGGEVRVIEGLRTGEARLGIGIAVPAQEITFELVTARRGSVIEVIGHAWTSGTKPVVTLASAAGILDARLAAAVGIAPPVYRPTGPLVPELTTHIPTPLDISTDPAVVGTNLLLSAIALLLLTISAKLATRMLAEHEDAISRRLLPVRAIAAVEARLGAAFGGRVHSRRLADPLRLLVIVAFYGLVFSLLEPGWSPFTTAGLWLFFSLTIANAVVGTADDLVEWRVARRWNLAADLAIRPTNALLAMLSTGVSRAAMVVPGLMFGTPEVLRLDESSLDETRARRLAVIGFVTLVAIGGASWVATIATVGLAGSGPTPTILGGIEALLLVVFAATLQNLFLALIGLPGTVGDLVRRWSPIAWGGCLLLVTFLFWHTLLNPAGDPSTALSVRNVQVTLGLVGGFTVVTVAAWIVLKLAIVRSAVPAPITQMPPVVASASPGEAAAPPAIVGTASAVAAIASPPPGLVPPSVTTPQAVAPAPPAMHPVLVQWAAIPPLVAQPALEASIPTADGKARGRMSFRIAGGWVEARTEFIDRAAMRQFRWFSLLSLLAWLVPLIAYAASLRDARASVVAGIGVLGLALAWLVAVIAARLWMERYRLVNTVVFPVRAIAKFDVGRDWNLGCGLMILLSPLVGILYLLLAGGRVVRIVAPLAADGPGPVSLRLKGTQTEVRYLEQLILAARSVG